MSTLYYPDDFDVDYHADWQWQRRQAALKSLEPGDVLAAVDDLIASEPDPAHHPLYSLAAHTFDWTTMPGTPEALWDRYKRLIDHAIERLIEQRLSDPHAWGVD